MDFYWNVEPILPNYVFRYIRFFYADGEYDEYSRTRFDIRDRGYVKCIAYFWEPSCIVRFDADGGKVNPDEKEYVIGKAYGWLPTPTKDGYIFKGWWTSTGRRGVEVTTASIVPDETYQWLYAKWERITHTISLRAYQIGGSALKVDGTEGYAYCGGYDTSDRTDKYNYRFIIGDGEESVVGYYNTNDYTLDHVTVNGVRCDSIWGWDYVKSDLNFIGYYKKNKQHKFTYLPMYLPSNKLLLRGVKNVLPIRDGDESGY